MNEETAGLFDRYLLGNLSPEERIAFEKELAVNGEVRKELEFFQVAISGITMNGRSVLKKQVAEIGAGIPAADFEKYSPSIKPKSFFKKWWWLIAVIVSATAIIIARNSIHKPSSPENETGFVAVEKARKDTPVINYKAKADSESVISPFSAPTKNAAGLKKVVDSVAAAPKKGFVCVVQHENAAPLNCKSYPARLLPQPSLKWLEDPKDYKFIWNSDYVITAGTSTTIIMVECCGQKNNPSYYYTSSITLLSYADTSGLRFYANGNSVIMTDGKPGYFVLTRGQKETPLKRVTGQQQFYDKENGDAIKAIQEGR